MGAAAGLALRDLSLGYRRRAAVHHVSMEVPAGALVALVGPNGAGKTTLLRGLAGEIAPIGGRIDWRHLDKKRVAYMPQQTALDRSCPVAVETLVAAGLWRERGLLGGFSRADRDRVGAALEAVGLAGFEGRPLRTLSGGQLQRALFARAMLQEADVILLDEPFAAVDVRTGQRLIELLLDWHARGRTVVAALHDHELVRAHFPHTLLLARELIGFGPTRDVLTPENLLRARRMGEAWREDAGLCEGHP